MNIFTKYKTDFIFVGILTTIFFVALSVLWSYGGSPIIDCGREAYLPGEMLKGKVLYKDIFNLYNPLSLQINALAYLILGEHLNSLYFVGAVNAYTILLLIYFISRTLSSALISFTACIITMSTCFFYFGIFNYIFPYTYAFPYALSAQLLSALFCIYYIKKNPFGNNIRHVYFIYLSFFFLGVSVANKFEYILSIIPLLFIISRIRPLSRLQIIYCLYSFLAMPFISWGIVFIRGLTFLEFFEYMSFGKRFFQSEALDIHYSSRFNLPITELTENILINFQIAASIFMTMFVFVSLFTGYFKKHQNQKIKRIVIQIIFAVFLIYFSRLQILHFIQIDKFDIFCWIALSTTVILILTAIAFLKQKNPLDSFVRNDEKIIFVFLAIIGILASLRTNLYIMIVYGSFLLPVLFIVNVIFLVKYLPEYFPKLKKINWESISCTVLIIMSLQFLFIHAGFIRTTNTTLLETPKGALHISEYAGSALKDTLDYINSEIPESASFLMLPEGPLFNFLTDRPSDNMYYNLIPNHIETFGEDKIVYDLSRKPPDYIFINNRKCTEYGSKYFCENFAFKICAFINTNYSLIKNFRSEEDYNYSVKIYKLDDNYRKKYGL